MGFDFDQDISLPTGIHVYWYTDLFSCSLISLIAVFLWKNIIKNIKLSVTE